MESTSRVSLPSGRRLALLVAVATVVAAALIVGSAQVSQAAPPANDTCSAPQELPLGAGTASGDTTEAANDYVAEADPMGGTFPGSVVPADGPDVVFRVDVPPEHLLQVVVQAGFNASVYATPVNPELPGTCGDAWVTRG